MQGANLVATPLDANIKLEPHEGGETMTTESSNYASLKGSLMYAAIGTHPYIAYATNKLCSFNKNLDLLNWTTAKHVLRHIKGRPLGSRIVSSPSPIAIA